MDTASLIVQRLRDGAPAYDGQPVKCLDAQGWRCAAFDSEGVEGTNNVR